jgi:hypothetical protein
LFWGPLASQEIRHHSSRLHNATNSSFEHASSQSRSGETISRISIHSRIHVSILSNKTPPSTCKSFRRGKSPSRSNSNRIHRKRHQSLRILPRTTLYLNQTCHIISFTISIFIHLDFENTVETAKAMTSKIPTTMRAIALTKFCTPAEYNLGTLPVPKITKPDELLIRVRAASVNPVDVKLASSYVPPNSCLRKC